MVLVPAIKNINLFLHSGSEPSCKLEPSRTPGDVLQGPPLSPQAPEMPHHHPEEAALPPSQGPQVPRRH